MADELLGAYPRVQVTDGTGQWILDNDRYRNWEQSRNGLLWINGLRELTALLSRNSWLTLCLLRGMWKNRTCVRIFLERFKHLLT